MHEARSIGPYQIVRELDAGGMGTVYLARDTTAGGRLMALKVIRSELERTPEHVEAFKREARLLSHLRHPNIVSLYDAGEIQGRLYIAMEYLEGMDLAKALRFVGRDGERMPLPVVAHVGLQCALALDSAHAYTTDEGKRAGLVHRDLSPHNVFLLNGGGVKILDFGLARAHGATAASQTGAVKGKFRYLAPEQARGDQIDERVDVFTLGLVLYEMLAGRRAYDHQKDIDALRAAVDGKFAPLREAAPDVPQPLVRVVERALRIDKRDRYPSALLLAEDINQAASELGLFIDPGEPRRFMDDLRAKVDRGSVPDEYVSEVADDPKASPPTTPSALLTPAPRPLAHPSAARVAIVACALFAAGLGIWLVRVRDNGSSLPQAAAVASDAASARPSAPPPRESDAAIEGRNEGPPLVHSAEHDEGNALPIESAAPSAFAAPTPASPSASARGTVWKRPTKPHRGNDPQRRRLAATRGREMSRPARARGSASSRDEPP